jgi:cytochrome c oxidase cbb3-type subunit 3
MCSRFLTETAVISVLALSGCGQGTASLAPAQNPAAAQNSAADVIDSALDPGVDHSLVSSDPHVAALLENPDAVQTGMRLFAQYNCNGCHSNGGGGMGPDLMDDEWIYGGRLEQIHQTIVQGRPNGMPSWGGKIPDEQIWQITAYVRSMSLPATLAAQNGPTPSQTPAALPRDLEQDAGWASPEDATNHFTTTTKGQ